jgi:hypothetical protein
LAACLSKVLAFDIRLYRPRSSRPDWVTESAKKWQHDECRAAAQKSRSDLAGLTQVVAAGLFVWEESVDSIDRQLLLGHPPCWCATNPSQKSYVSWTENEQSDDSSEKYMGIVRLAMHEPVIVFLDHGDAFSIVSGTGALPCFDNVNDVLVCRYDNLPKRGQQLLSKLMRTL